MTGTAPLVSSAAYDEVFVYCLDSLQYRKRVITMGQVSVEFRFGIEKAAKAIIAHLRRDGGHFNSKFNT